MKKLKYLRIIACIVIGMCLASCEKEDEPEPKNPVEENLEICTEQEVDLGLPSGTIWAGWNVGASSPEENGGYYAWGEIEEKDFYGYETYEYWDDLNGDGYWRYDEAVHLGMDISGTQYDVARQKWGGDWRMPTKKEKDELIWYCSWECCIYKDKKGCKVTGPNGKSIFLPAAGHKYEGDQYIDIESGDYWSSSVEENCGNYLVNGFGFSTYSCPFSSITDSRFLGYTVRPVK